MIINTDPAFIAKFNSYTDEVKEKLQNPRSIIHEVAGEIEYIHVLEETLK